MVEINDRCLPTSGAKSGVSVGHHGQAASVTHLCVKLPQASEELPTVRMRSSQDSAARPRDEVLAACTPAAWVAHFGSDDPVGAALRPLAAVAERRLAERAPQGRADTGQPLRRRGARYGARSLGRRLALTGTLAVLMTAGALGGTAQAAVPGVVDEAVGTATATVQEAAPAQPTSPPPTQTEAPAEPT
jgi:hypothetical protein